VAVISGAVMAGAGPRLQPHCVVPVVEGVAAAFRQAEALVRLGAAKPRAGAFAAPRGRDSVDLDPALAAALRGDAGGS
jgi:Asp/Glu/hydantoin racemase